MLLFVMFPYYLQDISVCIFSSVYITMLLSRCFFLVLRKKKSKIPTKPEKMKEEKIQSFVLLLKNEKKSFFAEENYYFEIPET